MMERFSSSPLWLLPVVCCLLVLSGCSAIESYYAPPPTPTPTPFLKPYDDAVATAEAGDDLTTIAMTYYERGNVQYGLGNFREAVENYNSALAIIPDNARFLNNRAVAYTALEAFDQALSDYALAVQIDPDYVRAYENRLVLRERLGDLPGMAADYGRLAELEPANRASYAYRQGAILRGLDDVEGARRAFDMAIAADPQHVDALYERAVLHYADGELDAALARLDAALQYSPRAANAYYVRGLIYNARGEHTRAINEFTQALTLRSDYAEALLARAAAYHASGDTISADADLDRLSQMELDETLEKAVSVLRLQLGHIQ